MASNNPKILTIGAAVQDVLLMGKVLTAKRDVREHTFVEVFPLGAKLNLDDIVFDTGGGATNAAVTFARQGLKVELATKIGHDPAGTEIVRVMKKEGVGTAHLAYDTKLSTGYSTILLAPSGERTILTYRGASHDLKAGDFDIKTFDADWFYISSLAGNFDLLKRLLKHAKASGIKIAFNPGALELAQIRKLRSFLPQVEILLANKGEMKLIFGGDDAREIMTRGFGVCPYVVMSDGPNGTYVTDSDKIYHVGLYQKVKIVDRTGVGDALGSGFVTAIARGQSVEEALTLGSANATSVATKLGAKAGILKTGRLKRMKVSTITL